MTSEQLHDAIGLIDDDLITETDALRQGVGQRKTLWLRCVAAAACLTVLLICLPILRKTLQPTPDGLTNSNTDPHAPLDGLTAAEATLSGADVDGTAPVASLTATIIHWQDDGFTAAIISTENEIAAANTHIQIIFTNAVRTEFEDQRPGYEGAPRPTDFPVGSTISVCFSNSSISSPDETFTVYADVITLIKTKGG